MTATWTPPPAPAPPATRPGSGGAWGSGGTGGSWGSRGTGGTEHSATRRTLLALLATALGITPLKALLADWAWLFDAWLTMAVVIVPAVLIRLRRAPSALDVWPGILLLVPWLTIVFVPQHAWGGFIPTHATLGDIGHLMDDLHRTTQDEVAPITSTVAVRLVVCALVGLVAALVDLVAVVGRRGALAGVPLLVVFTVAGAVPRSPVAWGWFVVAAVGFLLLLGLDAGDELHDWGRRIARRGGRPTQGGMGISAQRIGLLAILVAVVVPAIVPDQPRNLIADAFHSGNGNGIGGFGAGSGGDGTISPFVALKGQLDRQNPVTLAEVHVETTSGKVPFYLRTNVLDRYADDVGWSVSGHGPTQRIEDTGFGYEPPATTRTVADFQATLTVQGLTGNAPVFTAPRALSGVAEGTTWSPQDGILLGSTVHKGQQLSEQFAQPQPTLAELRAAPAADRAEFERWLTLPGLPAYVTDLVARLTRSAATPYDKARALSDFFADPANGFVYTLKTLPGDSGSALVDFLKNREGYCQQYAAALAVMLRAAGVPARVVLGYMHAAPDGEGNFTVSTLDAHAWVEGYFPTVGWVPFDPTPTTGLSGGRSGDLPWAPHRYPRTENETQPRVSTSPHQLTGPSSANASESAGPTAAAPGGAPVGLLWSGVAVLAVAGLCLIPAGTREVRRRRRLSAARHGDTDALWHELSDTARDLGYVWSSARSPRQVSAWLARDAGSSAPALDALAAAVEQVRYAPSGASRVDAAAGLVRGLTEVTGHLRARRSRRMRFRSVFWPASLGWGRTVTRLLPTARHR